MSSKNYQLKKKNLILMRKRIEEIEKAKKKLKSI